MRILAKARAVLVLPVPRGPANRYAWATLPSATSRVNVSVIWDWPMISLNRCGRYLRYSAWYSTVGDGNRAMRQEVRALSEARLGNTHVLCMGNR